MVKTVPSALQQSVSFPTNEEQKEKKIYRNTSLTSNDSKIIGKDATINLETREVETIFMLSRTRSKMNYINMKATK